MNNKKEPALLQVLGLGTAILLVAGNMIGSGVFKKITPMSAELMDGSLILWAWAVAGLITMLGAFSFASLATTTKEAGGQFQYFKNVFGDFFGFIYGWSFFAVISTASIASIAYVFAQSFGNLLGIPPILEAYSSYSIGGVIFPFQNASIKLIAISTLILLTLFNIRGVERGGWLSNIITGAKILGILLLIVLGFSYTGHGTESSAATHIANAEQAGELLRISAFFTAMLGAFWAYDGWVNITNMASEFKDPTKNIPRAIIIGTALTMFLYVMVNYAYLQVLAPADFAKLSTQEGSIAAVEVAGIAMGPIGVTLISVLIMISTFGATQASMMSAARVYYQMSKEGYFFKPFLHVHKRFHTPHISLIGQMIWACLLVISGTFDQLTDMLIFAAFIFYGLGAAAVIRLKITGKLQFTFGYPVVPLLFILFCSVIVANAVYTRPLESLTGMGLITLGIPLYLYFKVRNQ
ncbi:MAG: amino acid permease [Sulfurimonas sp.]|uniref:APC family permease n=1 Tax=Sulfurimonas sp. TaxID=2022749 RepID=UPI00261B2DA5|nr:amino acid permease [Sulfurimonas sp.]MDD5372931.1 amino acid permease [Sulfurimonas sp.]